MQIVIDIPEKKYNMLLKLKEVKNGMRNASEFADEIVNGTPLPKGHGRLIDADELKEEMYTCETNGRPLYVMELHERLAVIDDALTIVEADKGW